MRDYLHRMEREGVQRVKMFLVITAAYILFWGPLFFVTLVNHPVIGNPLGHEVYIKIYPYILLYLLRQSCNIGHNTNITKKK